jgi:hypothetical protein
LGELPSTISTTDQSPVALDAAYVLLASTGKPVKLPGVPRGVVGIPWLPHTEAIRLVWDTSWPSVLATTTALPALDSTGFVGARAPDSEDWYGSIVNDYQLVPRTPLRAGRGVLVVRSPFGSPPLPPTAASTQHVTVLALTARSYADQLDAAQDRDGAPHRQLRAEASQLRLFANRCEALLPELTAPWWPLARAAIEARDSKPIGTPAVPGSQYTSVPISPSR